MDNVAVQHVCGVDGCTRQTFNPTCRYHVPTCVYVKANGEVCGKRCGIAREGNFCYRHCAHMRERNAAKAARFRQRRKQQQLDEVNKLVDELNQNLDEEVKQQIAEPTPEELQHLIVELAQL